MQSSRVRVEAHIAKERVRASYNRSLPTLSLFLTSLVGVARTKGGTSVRGDAIARPAACQVKYVDT